MPGQFSHSRALAGWLGIACLGFSTLAFVEPAARGIRQAHLDGPPPGHTGGFGEPSCYACHFDNPINADGGSLAIDGLPNGYTPGVAYNLTVVLRRPSLRSAGFQLAARIAGGDSAGRRAGSLLSRNPRVAVLSDSLERSYAQHTLVGSFVTASDVANWQVEWTAPPFEADVVFHVAANAGDDNNSPSGDHIYTITRSIRPQQRSRQ